MKLRSGAKVLLVAGLFYAASLVSYLIGLPPSEYDYLPIPDTPAPWTGYDYLSLGLLMLAVGCTVAGVWLKRAESDGV